MTDLYLTGPYLIEINGQAGWHDGTLTVERDVIEIVSGGTKKPDPAWHTRDSQGHAHGTSVWDEDNPFPTLRTVQVPCGTPGHNEDCTVPEYRCRICGAVVEPRFVTDKPAGATDYIPGRLKWTATAMTYQDVRHIKQGDTVSVELSFSTPPHRYFGVAVVGQKWIDGGANEVELHGIGPLGKQILT